MNEATKLLKEIGDFLDGEIAGLPVESRQRYLDADTWGTAMYFRDQIDNFLHKNNLSSGGKAEHLEEARPRTDERPAELLTYSSPPVDTDTSAIDVEEALRRRDSERSDSPAQFTLDDTPPTDAIVAFARSIDRTVRKRVEEITGPVTDDYIARAVTRQRSKQFPHEERFYFGTTLLVTVDYLGYRE